MLLGERERERILPSHAQFLSGLLIWNNRAGWFRLLMVNFYSLQKTMGPGKGSENKKMVKFTDRYCDECYWCCVTWGSHIGRKPLLQRSIRPLCIICLQQWRNYFMFWMSQQFKRWRDIWIQLVTPRVKSVYDQDTHEQKVFSTIFENCNMEKKREQKDPWYNKLRVIAYW